MENTQKHIHDLSEIRDMMKRASKFISLSGFSGISAGIFALAGAALAWWYLDFYLPSATKPLIFGFLTVSSEPVFFLLALAVIVFITAFLVAIFFTTRATKKKNLPIWDYSSKRLLFNMMLPLFVGVIFILALIYYHYYTLLIPSSLIFYGLSLINGGHFTYSDIKYLGYCEIVLGLSALFFIESGIFIWAFGFGVLHIFYGIRMYFKYEK